MFDRIIHMILKTIVGQILKDQVRNGSIQAVKGYIRLVRAARTLVLGFALLGGAAALLVGGVLLLVVGFIGLLPVDPNTVAIILAVMGILVTSIAVVGFVGFFREKRWLEMSKAYELMDAALAPHEGIFPPNPLDIVRGKGGTQPAPRPAVVRKESEIELRADRPPPDLSDPILWPS